jgi:general secretion pathway protein D
MSESPRFFPSSTAVLSLAAAILGLCAPAQAGEGDLLGSETSRRQQATMEAQELLLHGDRAYKNGDYEQALKAYTGAFEALPDAPATAVQRAAALDRMVSASIARSQVQVRDGDLDGAKATLDKVLADGIAPDDVRARRARAQIDDPIRTNVALTPEHAKNIDEVRRALYTGEGAFNLGDYDKAQENFEKVLRIDPYNKAARRWLERIASARSDYYRAAQDHTRAEMLADVDREWEIQIKDPAEDAYGSIDGGAGGTGNEVTIGAKLDRIVFPVIDMEDSTLEEAADFIRSQSRDLDTSELDPQRRGVEIVLQLGQSDTPEGQAVRANRINLKLRNIPLRQALDYICKLTRTTWEIQEFAVVIRPAGASSDTLINRSYRVPPDFLTTAGNAGDAAPKDPFGDDSGQDGLLAKRLTARQVLEQQGIHFPEGASANYNPASSTLTVRTTAEMQALIQQVVLAATQTEPVQVLVKVTIMKTEERRLKELGFDWLMSPMPIGGGVFIGGGTMGNGSPIDDVPNAPNTTLNLNPLTSGNRSGDRAAPRNTLDSLIQETTQGFANASRRAPGVLTVHGLFDKVQFQMVIRALDQAKGIDLLSTPSVVTRSGQRASVQTVREMIYPTEYEPPELPNSVGDNGINGGGNIGGGGGGGAFPVTPAMPTAFEKRDIGMKLDVEPMVGPNRQYIDLVITPEISDFDGFVNYGSPINSSAPIAGGLGGTAQIEITPNEILMPIFSVNRANTALTVTNGSTVLIGGLMQESMTTIEDKVPVFGDIPLIGRLFQSSVTKPDRKVIMFFVTVELLDPSGKPYHNQ